MPDHPRVPAPPPEPVFHGVKFDVEIRHVPTPDGGTARPEGGVHPGAVAILPLLDDWRVVLIRNHRLSIDRTLWELCAGTLEPGEEPAATAARELIEETGYEASDLEPLTTFYPSPGITTERMYAFRARGLRHVGQRLEATERIEVEARPLPEVLEMIRRGEIRDGKTIATVLWQAAFAKEG